MPPPSPSFRCLQHLLFVEMTAPPRRKAEGEPLRRRRLARAWADAASQSRLMVHMAEKKRQEEMEQGGMDV